jgi:hypothetical protein
MMRPLYLVLAIVVLVALVVLGLLFNFSAI